MQFLPKSQQDYFVDTDNLILKLIAKTVLKEKKNVREITLPNFKIYYIATVIKTVILVAGIDK